MNKHKTGMGVLAASGALVAVLAVATREPGELDSLQSAVSAPEGARVVSAGSLATGSVDAHDSGPVTVETPSERKDWLRRYAESADDFSLAQELADAGMNGDARAQYVLGNLLLRCEIHGRGLAPYKAGTVTERVEAHLATLPHSLERFRRSFRWEVARCERLFTEDPFAGLDLPEEAKRFRFWSDLALESGDPLAVMNRASRSVAGRSTDGETDAAFQESLIRDVHHVVFSGDAHALFALGGIFSHPSVVADPTAGLAWLVAACELGYDCSKANPSVGGGCAEDGTCLAGETYLDVMQRDLGAAKYAAIYASAQDIQYKIRTKDWDGLQQYLQVKE